MRKIPVLAVVAAFLLLVPWVGMLDFGRIGVDGIAISAVAVMTLAVFSSMTSWSVLSWASKSLRPAGILLSVITGASLVIPFIEVLGPMAAVVVGIVAGFSAFMLQKKMADPARKYPVAIAAATLAAAYLALILLVLSIQSSHVWDTGDGIGSWSGTVEGIEESGFGNILNSGIGFVYFLVIVPSLAATVLVFRAGKIKTRYKVAMIAVLLFVVLDLPFFTSITVVNDAFEVAHILHFWSIPIHTEVSGMKPVYGVGEPIEFTVTHYNFGYYQEYPQYGICQENDGRAVISGGMTGGSVGYGPFTILTIWQESWDIRSYTEHYRVDQYGNVVDSKPQDGKWHVVSETRPIALGEPGDYTLNVDTTARHGQISIPFEVVRNEG